MPITKETKIQFTIGWFIATVLSVITTTLSVFTAFYFTVQKPNNDSIKERMEEQFELREKYLETKFGHIDQSLQGFSTGISNLNTTVGDLSRRQNSEDSPTTSNEGGFGN